MSERRAVQTIERWFSRVHLACWLAEGIISLIPAGVTAWLAKASGFSIIEAVLLGLGALFAALIIFAVFTVLIAAVVRPRSFVKGWPDVIRGKWKEDQLTSSVASTFLFYLKGEAAIRPEFGRVMMYFLPGGTRAGGQHGYLPHELWFSSDGKKLLRPSRIKNLTGDSFTYQLYFLNEIDCGGETIEEIKKSGNAFSFARPWW